MVVRLPLPPGTLTDTLGRRRAVLRRLPDGSPATILRATAATSTTTATCLSWAGSTTSSMWPDTGCPPGDGGGVASHPDVAECAVIGVADDLRGQVPIGLVVLKAGVDRDPDASPPSWSPCARRIGALAGLQGRRRGCAPAQDAVGEGAAPHMRHIADGEDYTVPATIDDPPRRSTRYPTPFHDLGYASTGHPAHGA